MNAQKEMIELMELLGTGIKCADITYSPFSQGLSLSDTLIKLKVDYTSDELVQFFIDLDFHYDDDFGTQELFGTVWFLDGTYADRGEYDGSEWWSTHRTPKIPDELIKGG